MGASRAVVRLEPPEADASEGWPLLAEEEIEAVVAVLRSGRLNYWTGDENECFEREFAGVCGTRYGVALANGSQALEVGLLALGLGGGAEVVVPARSFVATATSVVRVGSRPVFADVDLATQNLTAETVAAVATRRTRAVICVHLAGQPCEMDPLVELCRRRGLALIEDCAQAHGARYRGRPVGSIGDLGCFSFCQDKILTTGGEGGMVVTDRRDLWRRAWEFKDHGKSHRKTFGPRRSRGFRWLHDSIGTNARLTEMQAAIGRCQLRKLEAWLADRARRAAIYRAALEGHPLVHLPPLPVHARPAFYKLYFFLRSERLAADWSRDRVLGELEAAGVPCFEGSCPEIYRERAFAGGPFAPPQRLPNARRLGETALMLEVHPSLREATVETRAEVLRRVLDRALAGPFAS